MQFSYNKNKVTSLNYTPSIGSVYSGSPYKGQSIGYIAVHRYGGLDENGQPTFLLNDDNTQYSYGLLGTLTIDDLKFVGRTTTARIRESFYEYTLSRFHTQYYGNL